MTDTSSPSNPSANHEESETTRHSALGTQHSDQHSDDRFKVFHSQGRWQGLPLRVEDTGEAPRFEPLFDDGRQPDVLAFGVPNHGMMAGQPTNVYLLGYVADQARKLTLVDTGDVKSYDVLLTAFDETGIDLSRIDRIVLTHCHPDHVGNAAALKQATGAPIYAHPLEQNHLERFGSDLVVDVWIEPGQSINCDGFTLETIFTPGHSPGHYCVVEPQTRVLLAGDMISGFGSVGIFPPHGSMRDYIESLHRLLAAHEARPFSLVGPGHGPPIADARAKIEEYITHRLAREEEVYGAVVSGASTVDTILPIAYPDVQPHLSFAARSTLQAHLDKLVEDGRVSVSQSAGQPVSESESPPVSYHPIEVPR
jgi:glyoxylase-like metal-dependent hydrolase (beta-lactamase superfamily II)